VQAAQGRSGFSGSSGSGLSGLWQEAVDHSVVGVAMYIRNMYFCHRECLRVSGSCWTRISGWSNPRVYWTDAVAFRCIWEHMRKIWVDIGGPVTTRGAPGSAGDKPGSTDEKPGSTWDHWRHA